MSAQWLHDWFPVVGLFLQTIFWAQFLSLHGSPQLQAIITFRPLPSDPNF